MSDIHPVFADILNAFTGGPASQAGHNLAAAAENAEMHAARHDAREVAESKDRVRSHIQDRIGGTIAAIDKALGRECCPKCGGELVDEPARKAEPDTGVRAFAGGTACDDCGAEFEAEDTRDDYDWHRIRRGQVFLLPLALCLFAGWLTLPTAPTPIDDSLPSSGLHDAGRATNPAPVTDGWRGFLWTT